MVDEVTKDEAATDDGTITKKLTKPIHDGEGGKTSQITFREPVGADVEKCGMPVTLNFDHDPPRMIFNAKEMSAMMSQLSALPPSSIKMLAAKDWTSCAWALGHFFLPDLGS
jgi:hypothetical protein